MGMGEQSESQESNDQKRKRIRERNAPLRKSWEARK